MKVFVVGVGLIGGSMSLDIQENYKNAIVSGIDKNETNLEEALTLGVIHQKATFKDLEHAEIVIVSIPVDAQLEVVPIILKSIASGTALEAKYD